MRWTPGSYAKYLPQSFVKLLPLLPPLPLKPPWTGRFIGWWQHLFLYGKKGCYHHFYLFFTPKIPYEEEETRGEGWPNAEKGREYRYTEPGNRTGRTSPTNEQDIGYSLMGVWLRPARTTVTSRQSHSYNTVELQFLPDGTKVSTWWNRLKLLVRVRVHTDERDRSYASTGASASSGKIVGKYRTSGKNKKKWWQ